MLPNIYYTLWVCFFSNDKALFKSKLLLLLNYYYITCVLFLLSHIVVQFEVLKISKIRTVQNNAMRNYFCVNTPQTVALLMIWAGQTYMSLLKWIYYEVLEQVDTVAGYKTFFHLITICAEKNGVLRSNSYLIK